MSKTLQILALLAIAVASASSCTNPASSSATSITNVTVIDAKRGVRVNQTVVFDGDNIVAAGPAEAIATTGTLIDGSGAYLIPGLWDMHVHLTYDDRFTPIMPAAFLDYGVTSIRDTGGMLEKLLPVVERMRNGDSPAPRVFFSGPLLDGKTVVYDGESAPRIGLRNDTAQTARQNVERLVANGASFIKIYEMVEPGVFAALVDAANANDIPIAAHVPLSMNASEAGPKVNSMEHLRNLELDCAANSAELLNERQELLGTDNDVPGITLRGSIHKAQRNRALEAFSEERCNEVLGSLRKTIQVPTTVLNTILLSPPFERDDWPRALRQMPEAVQRDWGERPEWVDPDPQKRDQAFGRFTLDTIAMMHAAGVPIGAGTDTPIAHAIPGYSLHNELEALVLAGLPPLEALRAATVRPAEFFSLDHEMGAIEAGMRADMVLLTKDPLADIRNTRSIRLVVSRGHVVSRTSED